MSALSWVPAILLTLAVAGLSAYKWYVSGRMGRWFWPRIAKFLARPRVATWLIARAMKTPYTHLPGYMNRYWLFNAYEKKSGKEVTPVRWLPSIRIHHILRRDDDRHLHDHPWDARTIILKGLYVERRGDKGLTQRALMRGDTATIGFGEYHTITYVPDDGVWTLFITFGHLGEWGLLVDGKKVPWPEYLEANPEGPWSSDETQP